MIPQAKQAYLLGLVIIVLSIASCSSLDTVFDSSSRALPQEVREANRLTRQNRWTEAAQVYWQAAQQQPSPQREEYQLRATELLIKARDWLSAAEYSAHINEQALPPELLARKRIADADISIAGEQYPEALAYLPLELLQLAPEHQLRILELRAQAFAGQGDILASVNSYVRLSRLPMSGYERTKYQENIWKLLASARPDELQYWLENSTLPDLTGWIELAQLRRNYYDRIDQIEIALDRWRLRFPNHPASENLLSSIMEDWESFHTDVRNIAILLPMTGRYEKLSRVIYAGIQTAHESAAVSSLDRPSLRLYDLGERPESVISVYEQAVAQGADFVIGPLSKEAVNYLAQHTLSVPVLTLNYADPNIQTPVNFFQFGLLPENESQQVAERASLDGHLSAIALAPNNEWGQRLVESFAQRFEELGGTLLQTEYYVNNSNDFSTPIKNALQLDQSEQRFRQLRNKLGRNLEYEPRRRQDVDMIFLISSPQTGRSIRPQINYYYGNDLTVYSTSHIFSGISNVRFDRDIDGVIYCDIPWILNPSVDHELFRDILETQAPEAYNLLPRFAALGIDAFQVIPNLRALAGLPYERFDGVTGTLRITEGNRIFRELNWARFKNGKPEILNSSDVNQISGIQ